MLHQRETLRKTKEGIFLEREGGYSAVYGRSVAMAAVRYALTE